MKLVKMAQIWAIFGRFSFIVYDKYLHKFNAFYSLKIEIMGSVAYRKVNV